MHDISLKWGQAGSRRQQVRQRALADISQFYTDYSRKLMGEAHFQGRSAPVYAEAGSEKAHPSFSGVQATAVTLNSIFELFWFLPATETENKI